MNDAEMKKMVDMALKYQEAKRHADVLRMAIEDGGMDMIDVVSPALVELLAAFKDDE